MLHDAEHRKFLEELEFDEVAHFLPDSAYHAMVDHDAEKLLLPSFGFGEDAGASRGKVVPTKRPRTAGKHPKEGIAHGV
eukprot:14905386-Alexandrium_andersonii.AAC.1